jgi:hypothetical protein
LQAPKENLGAGFYQKVAFGFIFHETDGHDGGN